MDFEQIKKILEKYNFFGFTVKRDGDSKLEYTFRSISYYAILITVEVIRVNPETFGCKKLVARITINGKEINGPKELKNELNNIYALQKRERVKLFKQV